MKVIGMRATMAYPTLLALGALDAAGYSVIAPVLPQIAARTGMGPAVIGLLVAAFPLGIVVGLDRDSSDRAGRVRPLVTFVGDSPHPRSWPPA